MYAQALIAYERLKIQIQTNGYYSFNNSTLTITTPTGSKIVFKSGEKPDNLYGDDVYAVVMDEFTRMREQSWFAIRSTLTKTKGKCKFIGNARGKGWGYQLGLKASQDTTGTWNFFKITAYDAVAVGLLDVEEIEDAKKTLPEEVFNELYLAIPSDNGINPFGVKAIQACVKPLSKLPAVCYGIDLAKTVDYTVIVGLDNNKDVCYFDRFQLDWNATKKKILALPKNVDKLIDATGVGDPLVEDMQIIGQNIEGYKYTMQSKQNLMMSLQDAIQNKTTSVLEGVMQDELESFEIEYTRQGVRYNAPSGVHDDCVNALALANFKWRKKGNGTYNLI